MTSSADKDRDQERFNGQAFQPVSSYIPCNDKEGHHNITPKRLFDVQSMRLIETSRLHYKFDEKYVAISYSWNEKFQIDLQDSNISWKVRFATPNWLSIICEKIKAIQIRYIWIDALCINQDSKEDKESQVPFMGDYYHGAEFVMVVLDDIEQYRDYILASASILKTIPDNIEYKTRYSSVPDWFKLEHFVAAHNLIAIISKTRWSKRVWTVQEITLSNKAIYFIPGVTSFTDEQLSTLIMLKYMGGSSQVESITKHMMELPIKIEVTESLSVESIIPNRNNRHLPITAARQLLLGRSCQREQDKVYGMLGLLHYGRELKVDYRLTLPEIEKLLYTLASQNGDNTWISGNGERHPHQGWSMAMRSESRPIPSTIVLLSAPKIHYDCIELVGGLCGTWKYVKELVPLLKPDIASGPGYREVPLTKTCTSIITAISMRSSSLESSIDSMKSAFYLYEDENDLTLASLINRNELFDGLLSRFFLNGIGKWSREKLVGKDEGALFASVVARMNTWYGFGSRLSLIEIDTNGNKSYKAVASLDQDQESGFILIIGIISKNFLVCVPVTKMQEKFKRVGGVILMSANEIGDETEQKNFQIL